MADVRLPPWGKGHDQNGFVSIGPTNPQGEGSLRRKRTAEAEAEAERPMPNAHRIRMRTVVLFGEVKAKESGLLSCMTSAVPMRQQVGGLMHTWEASTASV